MVNNRRFPRLSETIFFSLSLCSATIFPEKLCCAVALSNTSETDVNYYRVEILKNKREKGLVVSKIKGPVHLLTKTKELKNNKK